MLSRDASSVHHLIDACTRPEVLAYAEALEADARQCSESHGMRRIAPA